MREKTDRPGRPKGSTTYYPRPAKAFGAAVLAIRLARSESQEDICGKAKIGQAHLSKIENGRHMPNLALILRLAEAFGMSAAELLAETERHLKLLGDDAASSKPKPLRPRRPRPR